MTLRSGHVQAARIRVTGIVQGVGYRPFVWRLAREIGLAGWVRNDSEGVEIAAEGAREHVEALVERLRHEAPPLARVDTVTSQPGLPQGASGFSIVRSRSGGTLATTIGADVGVCADCLAEMCDPTGRRWRHAFITCTHCGPRYTVTRALPYDRPQTSLAPFPLCAACAAEYADPADRRFHAETTCCPACGPHLKLEKLGSGDTGPSIEPGADPMVTTLALLRAGAIVAIKGLGGFHLACDATNASAVAALRERKSREAKPFAVMVANLASAQRWARIGTQAAALLESAARPIVLLPRRPEAPDPLDGIAPGLDTLGLMLPATPIQHLLFHEAASRPSGTGWLQAAQDLVLVMTSANPGGEPIVRDDSEARQRLGGIADYLLGHDREIVACCDDSVLRIVAGAPQFIRRSRGHAPQAIRLARGGPPVLGFGSQLKNTVCVTRGDQAFLSPHIGGLDNAAACRFQHSTVTRMLDLLALRPAIIAHDLHPDSQATQAALAFAAQHGLPALGVQHHHAHIAAVCAEQGVTEPVVGLALDGIGHGSDGGAWGGELLRVAGADCVRLGHLAPLALPGGDAAAREPWRMAAAVLHRAGRNAEIVARFGERRGATTVATMLARHLNCPPTSSLGRVFDAAAALLGVSLTQRYEAEAAMRFEQAAVRHVLAHGWPQARSDWRIEGGELDLLPLLLSLAAAEDAGQSAARFHAALADALAEWTAQAARAQGLGTIALGGGCFFNALLTRRLCDNLAARGLKVLRPLQNSPGDGGIALGQAWVALCAQGD